MCTNREEFTVARKAYYMIKIDFGISKTITSIFLPWFSPQIKFSTSTQIHSIILNEKLGFKLFKLFENTIISKYDMV